MVSIIVRTKNEERWIASCLNMVFNQDYKDIEVIVVDNKSTDKTVEKARQFDVKIVEIDKYLPGNALNEGIKASKGEFVVCLSAHCIPRDDKWLSSLIRNFDSDEIAGVYGRQEPMSFSSDLDKRDLLITFGLDKRVQVKDSFFHNANSMIKRKIWEEIPFDDKVSNIEDRLWAEKIIKKGYKIIYEPEASVYHYHGIHQNADTERCRNVVRILEGLHDENKVSLSNGFDILKEMNVAAIIPVKGDVPFLGGKCLLEYTIERAKQSKYIKDIIVSTDNKEVSVLAEKLGAKAPFLRDQSLSEEYIDLEKVLQFSLDRMEEKGILPDLIVSMEITFPFRKPALIDDLIEQLISGGFDSVIAARKEFNSCWTDENGEVKRIDEGFIPRKFKKPVYVGMKGLGCVTYPAFLREGKLLGTRVGIVTEEDPHAYIEVRNKTDVRLAENILPEWGQNISEECDETSKNIR